MLMHLTRIIIHHYRYDLHNTTLMQHMKVRASKVLQGMSYNHSKTNHLGQECLHNVITSCNHDKDQGWLAGYSPAKTLVSQPGWFSRFLMVVHHSSAIVTALTFDFLRLASCNFMIQLLPKALVSQGFCRGAFVSSCFSWPHAGGLVSRGASQLSDLNRTPS